MPYVTDRWLGGMLTNFGTIRKSLKKMQDSREMLKADRSHGVAILRKEERLMLTREKGQIWNEF